MDIFRKIVFSNHIYDEFFPIHESLESYPIKPSVYMEEMVLTTEQRLERMKRNYFKSKSKNSEQLDIVPNAVVFQNFEQNEIITLPIYIVNSSKMSCSLRFYFPKSPYFTFSYPDTFPEKLAPGMKVSCLVHFNPELLRDYQHQMKVVTESKEYTVPIIGISSRALLTLPDNIILQKSFVQIGVKKVLLVQNIGKVPGIFTIHSEPPFHVTPSSGSVNPNDSMQLTIEFKPDKEGELIGPVIVKFDSGDILVFTVKGKVECADISLSSSKVYFDNTYVGLKCEQIIQIHNKCDQLINFTWKKFKSNEQDKIEADKMKENLIAVRESETRKSTKLETNEVIDNDINDKIYKRIYDDEVIDFDKSEQFIFKDPDFLIIPEEGEVGPNHITDVSLIFRPTEVRDFHSEVFCKVTGRSDRLPLNLYGFGIGPKFIFNLDSIDLCDLYIYFTRCFELVVCNNGDIPGTVSFVNKEYDFGCKFFCTPVSLELKPFEHGVFGITLTTVKEGSFIEEIHFMISDSKEICKILVKGVVLYAELKVTETLIDFGYVAIGQKVKRTIQLINTTCVNIPYECTVIPDGIHTPLILDERSICEVPINPKQFICVPNKHTVPAKSSFNLVVQLFARYNKLMETYLYIDAWNCKKLRLKIVLIYIGALPELVCNPSLVNIRSCFLNYLFERIIVINNRSHYSGYLWMFANTTSGLKITTDISNTFIKPYEIKEVVLNITCTELGKQDAELIMQLYGSDEKVACHIKCTGQGPIVITNPDRINFGEVQLLKVQTKTITVYNDSPIPAKVNIEVRQDTPFNVDEKLLCLEPEESKSVAVSVYLNDNKRFTSCVTFHVMPRGTFECKLSATGVGTAIVVEPSISPVLNLGPQLTYFFIKKTFKVTNKGVKNHKIIVTSLKEFKGFQTYSPEQEDDSIIFSKKPHYFILKPNDIVDLVITGQNNQVEDVNEPLYFHAIVEDCDKRLIIIESAIVCKFVVPQFEYSKKELSFRVDHYVDKSIEVLLDVLQIKNITPLPLEVDVTVQAPFFIDIDNSKFSKYVLVMGIAEEKLLNFYLEPPNNDEHSKVIKSHVDVKCRRHIKKDIIKISAQINYPNITFFPSEIDFGCIIPSGHAFSVIELRNTSPITVAYKLTWLLEESQVTTVQGTKFVPKMPVTKEETSEMLESSQSTEEEIIVPTQVEDIKVIKDKTKPKGKEKNKGKEKEKEKTKGKEKKEIKGKGKEKDGKSKEKHSKKGKSNLLPMEYVYLHYYTETYLRDSYIQISELLREPIGVKSLIGLTKTTRANLEEMCKFLNLSVEKNIPDDNLQVMLKYLSNEPVCPEPIAQVVSVSPTRGLLDPFESQNLYISFSPKFDTSTTATVLCEILGGPIERLCFRGSSLDIHYEIEKTHIKFGRQVCSEVTVKKLKLKNVGLAPFSFTVYTKNINSVPSSYLLEVGWLSVEPITGVVKPHSEFNLLLNYFSGIAGNFSETFELEIGNFLPITITTSGFGMFPQIYLNLVRPSIYDVDAVICYEAIGKLNSDFLECVESIQIFTQSEEAFFSVLSKEEKRALQRDGWSIISYNQKYPSKMDIELAIERVLAYKLLCRRQNLLLNKMRNNLGILAPSYIVDFGIIVTNTIAHYTVMVMNYGPTKVKLRSLLGKQLISSGFQVYFKPHVLEVGETTPCYILFTPVSDTYPDRYHEVNQMLYIECVRGLRIPLEVKAIVAKPFLIPSNLNINFGQVICGNVKIIILRIANKSLVACVWKARIELKGRFTFKHLFSLNTYKGYLQPDNKQLLEVTFEPTISGTFEAEITFEIEQNTEIVLVTLRGEAAQPHLIVDKDVLQFEPLVLYAPPSIQYFYIHNPSNYAIEYIFSDYDTQIIDEEKIRLMLCEFYKKEKLQIPQRFPGAGLPSAFYNFCETVFQTIKSAFDVNQSVVSMSKLRKSKKKKEISVISLTAPERFLDKSDSYLINLIREYLTLKSSILKDPLDTAILEADESAKKKTSNNEREGFFFVFYGAPLTDYVYAANKLAKQLNLPVYNLNEIIFEALAHNSSLACIKINDLINEAYNNLEIVPTSEEKIALQSKNPYAVLDIKLKYLLPKSDEQTKGKTENPIFLGIQQELFIELLTHKLLKYKNGLIIEKLDNKFIRQPILTVLYLLQAIHNLKYIHFIVMGDTANNYIAKLEEAKALEQIIKEKEKMMLIEHFDSITEEELDNLSPSHMHLYKQVYIEARKEWIHAKSEIFKNKNRKVTSTKLNTYIARRANNVSLSNNIKVQKVKDVSPKYTPEEEEKIKEFLHFEKIFVELIHIAENWDRKLNILIKEYPSSRCLTSRKETAKASKTTIGSAVAVHNTSTEIPLWIIRNSDIEILSEMVQTYSEYQAAYESFRKSLIHVFVPDVKTLTIIQKPIASREQNTSQEFSIITSCRYTNLIYPNEEEMLECNESVSEMAGNITTTPISNSNISEKRESESFKFRDILEPGEKRYYCVLFASKYVDYYEFPINIEPTLSGPSVKILCKASCDTPRINTNPKTFFPYVIEERTQENKYIPNVFIEKDNIFDFGNKIISQPTPKKTSGCSQSVDAAFKFENISLVPCYISIHLKYSSEAFQIDSDILFIRPLESTMLTLHATPCVMGENVNILLISIKDNPRVEVIDLLCTGCKFDFYVSPKKIQFERALQHHYETKSVLLTNNCGVPVNWQILNCDILVNNYILESEFGYIKPFSESQLNITYLAPNVEIVPPQKLFLEVCEAKYLEQPLLKTHIELSAETCELLVCCPEDINFGQIKTKISYEYKYKFFNEGKYNILFELEPLYTDEILKTQKKPILDKLEIYPVSGMLIPQKENSIDIAFSAARSVNITRYSIAKCDLLDQIEGKLLSSFFITLSFKSSYSKFEIYPTPELNFGAMLVGTTNSQILTITNTGKVDFNYTIFCKKIFDELQKKKADEETGREIKAKSAKSTKSVKSNTSASSKKQAITKDIKVENIFCGPYVCKNSSGNIKPNEKIELEIECTIKTVGKHEEMLIIFISECLSKDKSGKIINLKVSGYLPEIDYTDYDLIFGEHFIVEKIEDFIKPKEVESHCVFSKHNTCLTFNNTCINTVSSGRIQLFNNGLVESVVEVSLTPATAFKINPKILTLPSYSNGFFTVEFHPKEIQTYNATLEFSTIMPSGYENKTKLFSLMGEGKIPQITIKNLKCEDDSINLYRIIYNPTLNEKCSKKPIIIKNYGDLPCKVIIEICENSNKAFSLQVEENTIQKLSCSDTKFSKHLNAIKLTADDVGTFDLNYKPKSIGKHTCLIKVHVVNNPYETIMIEGYGESFSEDIFIDELPTAQLDKDLLLSISDTSLTNVYGSSYILDFKEIYPKTLHKIKFKIINRSTEYTYKFVFRSSLAEVNFIPAVGHLQPMVHKIIIATFISQLQVVYNKIYMDCLICKITYMNSNEYQISWDDRQKLVIHDEEKSWDEPEDPIETDIKPKSTKKDKFDDKNEPKLPKTEEELSEDKNLLEEIIASDPEPEYEVENNSIQNIPIFFSALVDYPSYICDTHNIKFADTFLFDKRIVKFSIFNNGNVNLEITWNIMLQKSILKLANQIPEQKTTEKNTSAQLERKRTQRPHSRDETFIGEQCNKGSLNSSEASLNVFEKIYVPITINPETTLIKPHKKQTFTVIFAPLDVFEYKAYLNGIIRHALSKEKCIHIELSAKSLIPCCHFEVDLSDYLTSGRRQVKNCNYVIDDVTTKVIEMTCLGVGVQHTKTFNIVNPTDDELQFTWQLIKSYEINSIPIFNCYNVYGSIERGKILPVTFGIVPQSIGIFEAIYNFKIEKYDITMPFLFVANVRESDVRFLYSNLILKPTVLGISVSNTAILKNNENVDLNFRFKKSSLYSEGRQQCLTVEPLRGVIPKKGEFKIKVSFNPNDVGEESFTLVCLIECLVSPVLLSVTTKCYEVQPTLNCIINGTNFTLSSDTPNIFNFDYMLTHNDENAKFVISNTGNIGFYYNWNFNYEFIKRNFNFDISPREGYVKVNTETSSLLTLTPIKTGKIRNFKIDFQVKYGPTYKILINGCSSNRTRIFSFTEYNFGPCLIQKSGNKYYQTTLEFFNDRYKPITLECTFLNTDYLNINFESNIVSPKKKQMIDIYFTPRRIKKYSEDLVFIVNSQKTVIKILGEGILLDIALVNIIDKEINLGSPQVGTTISKSIKVINKCSAKVDAFFDIWDRLPIVMYPLLPETHFLEMPQKIKIIGKEERKRIQDKGVKDGKSTKGSPKLTEISLMAGDASKETGNEKKKKRDIQQDFSEVPIVVESLKQKIQKKFKSMISFSPKMPITILPNKTAEFTIHYSPSEKIQPFSDKISVQVLEVVQSLCNIKGACIGPVFYLDRDEISFGAVVVNCVRQTKLMLLNEGDVSSKIKWLCNTQDFSITPIEAYSSAGLSIIFTIKYYPTKLNCQSIYKAQCILESFHKPLCVKLIGLCAAIPPAKEIVKFSCPVRSTNKHVLSILNNTNTDWELYPEITGDYFSCPKCLFVPSKETVPYEITYEPLRMTKSDHDAHKGIIFLKRPDGEAIVYDLHGIASQPDVIETRTVIFPCKTNHKEVFNVYNWTLFKQQFKVFTEDNTDDNLVNLYEVKGLASIEISSKSERKYEWYIYVYKECLLDFNIIFMNEEKEYMFYNLIIKVVKTKPLETINLMTCVRTPVTYGLILINPLAKPITYRIISGSSYLIFSPSVDVGPNTEVTENIIYNPLLEENTVVQLEATCTELGTYLYEFVLVSSPPIPAEPIYFSVVLGEKKIISVNIQNLSRIRTIFHTEIEKNFDSFIIEQSYTLAAGQVSAIRITICPIEVGNIDTVLKFYSVVAGDFIFPIIGKCEEPTPKGPYNLYPGKNINIDFFNPFPTDEEFLCTVKPDIFTLKSSEEMVKSRVVKHITVSMANLSDDVKFEYPITGKLIISSKYVSANWVYYLNGIPQISKL